MGTARQINDLKEIFTEISNNNLENEEFEILDDARLNALINMNLRKHKKVYIVVADFILKKKLMKN